MSAIDMGGITRQRSLRGHIGRVAACADPSGLPPHQCGRTTRGDAPPPGLRVPVLAPSLPRSEQAGEPPPRGQREQDDTLWGTRESSQSSARGPEPM